jgi:hypothetical protein
VRKSRPRAFSLLELAIAIALALLIFAIAIPALDGVFAAGRLQRTMDKFDRFAMTARDRSVAEGRVYVMVWSKKKIRLVADGPQREGIDDIQQVFIPGDGELYSLVLPSALDEEPAPEWTFWPTGTCEPATVSYKGPAGTWEVRYSPLSARAAIRSFIAK